ncbi:unnamed protein product, partial [Prorocentrum cordatum]
MIVVNGDFNFASHESVLLHMPAAAVRRSARQHHARAPQWRAALAPLLEIECDAPTHYGRAGNAEASTDRLYCSRSGWQMCQLVVQTSTVDFAALVSDKLVSDHAAVVASFAPRAPRVQDERAIPKHIFNEPAFKQRLEGLIAASGWFQMPPPVKLEHYEKLMKIASAEESHPLAGDMIVARAGKVEPAHPPSFQSWVDQVQSAAASTAK